MSFVLTHLWLFIVWIFFSLGRVNTALCFHTWVLNGTQHNTRQRSSTQQRHKQMDPSSHPPATDTQQQRACVCVSWVVSRCFLAGVRWESTHGERGGHPDEAWRRKNEVWGECWHCDGKAQQKPPPPLCSSQAAVELRLSSNIFVFFNRE